MPTPRTTRGASLSRYRARGSGRLGCPGPRFQSRGDSAGTDRGLGRPSNGLVCSCIDLTTCAESIAISLGAEGPYERTVRLRQRTANKGPQLREAQKTVREVESHEAL